ncbi:prolyl-tRNA editing enzyme YbaK/EbsC (Cys-tRNA(Pro) deacylase) [Thermocatellispora tengchongensis]|uniref:Prolyl-tRNA editing enzyme YbaK/EbsC (Cys-tRNA(Pro) deacylase) n=1 Tax=Thermocatellispora tengchongensis TaxID=1073253 RepID=A0A840P297_9ACTN|nr:YbaK/EbsC family protein [Thermocatellispora tengchongensis]MBB5132616.1 prolyl-tRNA editing enzyme YbaK/EbsC (Cys-tRNA(Pro) deacylase) [Thermocatellispora tengchongensis]
MALGTLDWAPAPARLDLLAEPVAAYVRALGEAEGSALQVAEIDPELADTAAFCERYSVGMDESANCVIVAGKRGGEVRYAACMVLATTRADVNGVVRKHLDARKVSFAPQAEAVRLTAMEYGGITPLGLPDDWPVLVDEAVAAHPMVVIGSGLRRSKLALPGAALAALKTAEVLRLAN